MVRQIASVLLLSVALSAHAAVEIVAPRDILQDGDFTVRVTGLDPGATIDLQCDFVTPGGSIWRSVATFTADEHGGVAPPDPQALISSMEKTKETPSTTATLENDDRSIVTVTALLQGKKLAEQRIVFLKRRSGISTTEISEPFVGVFDEPYGKRGLPGVIVLGGSEGGVNRSLTALLASHGFAALAVGYFGIDKRSEALDRIPVETVDRAVEWLRAQPSVDPSRIAVLGGSKGAELALVAASLNPAIRAVVAISPSSVVYQSITYGKGGVTSSWSAAGKDLPFAPYVETDAYTKSHRLIDLYEPTLAAAPAAAVIPVEKIHGPILLLSGKDDLLWPSAAMAQQIAARAKEKGFRYTVTNLTLENAGHHVASLPNRPTSDSVRLGGTAQGIAQAQVRSWRTIVEFLDRSLRISDARSH